MLAMVSGRVAGLDVAAGLALIEAGAFTLELHIPQSAIGHLSAHIGQVVSVHTWLELTAPVGSASILPRLFGFLDARDKAFFLKLITVKGIGAAVALEMMSVPAARIAQAIQAKDEKFLKGLPRIGASKAKQLIAELAEKVGEFAETPVLTYAPVPEDALTNSVLAILVQQLQLEESEARALLGEARTRHPESEGVQELLGQVFALRGGR